jgi:hypothetical protein
MGRFFRATLERPCMLSVWRTLPREVAAMTLDVIPNIKVSSESAQLLKLSAFALVLICTGLGLMAFS